MKRTYVFLALTVLIDFLWQFHHVNKHQRIARTVEVFQVN